MSTTDTTIFKKKKIKTEKVSLSLRLPEDLYGAIRKDLQASKKQLTAAVEELIDQNASLLDANISLATLMTESAVLEKTPAGSNMKILTVPVSNRHYNLIRLEAMRQNSKVRTLMNDWLQARFGTPELETEWPRLATAR